jgi:hypothetical protein
MGGARLSTAGRNAGVPVARARFAPEEGDAVFRRAVRAAARAGSRRHTCDADRRRIETARLELDAPCGPTTCLARETVEVALGYRTARVKVAREVYDGAAKTWRAADAGDSAAAARTILAGIVSPTAPGPRGDACASAARLEVSALHPASE